MTGYASVPPFTIERVVVKRAKTRGSSSWGKGDFYRGALQARIPKVRNLPELSGWTRRPDDTGGSLCRQEPNFVRNHFLKVTAEALKYFPETSATVDPWLGGYVTKLYHCNLRSFCR